MSLRDELRIQSVSRSPVTRAVRWFAASRFGAWALSGTLRHLDRWVTRALGGRSTVSDLIGGVPTIFLTCAGARSGLPRTSQLIPVPDGDDLLVIGSNFGRARAPLWVLNLAAAPQATISRGRQQVSVTARELLGAEAERAFTLAAGWYRGFESYPAMAGNRTIRVFRLTRS